VTESILLCCDLDRTLIPNGPQPASPDALPRFRRVAARAEIRLAYVTGRSRALVEEAIRRWDLPLPDVAACDVGSAIYDVGPAAAWTPWSDWSERIGRDWRGRTARDIAAVLADIPALALQAEDRQTPLKVSFAAPPETDADALLAHVRVRLAGLGIVAAAVWSIDETRPIGLLDVLPASATKRGAVEFIRQRLGFPAGRTLFAGDSGNDLPVLAGPCRAVLVANATPPVRTAARRRADGGLYAAKGGFLGMNGAYAAGVLEGLAHFFPETRAWMDEGDESPP
jgi:HAD superfamily hydrolase (TIGR01484 family)